VMVGLYLFFSLFLTDGTFADSFFLDFDCMSEGFVRSPPFLLDVLFFFTFFPVSSHLPPSLLSLVEEDFLERIKRLLLLPAGTVRFWFATLFPTLFFQALFFRYFFLRPVFFFGGHTLPVLSLFRTPLL